MSNKRLPGRPLVIVISSPSGGGKSTLCRKLLLEYQDISYSISCTTRAPRGEEKDGESYHFMDRSEFTAQVEKGSFLEYAEVHGNMYGTLKSSIDEALTAGCSVILDIDVQGAAQIRSDVSERDDLISRSFLDIFVTPPSLSVLRDRIEGRAEDDEDSIELRLNNAQKEMRCASDYRYVIENGDIEKAYAELAGVLEKESGV
jgi:guanylate kinase